MRKFTTSAYVTLNGVVENPHLWPGLPGGHSEEGGVIQTNLLEACDIVLMGRRTYDVFASSWPERSGDPYSDRINSMRKVVASTTLRDPQWHNTEVVSEHLAERLAEIKAEDGGEVIQYGFGPVSLVLLEHGLLDELQLWIQPQFVDATVDDLLFRPGVEATFELRETRPLDNGIVIHTYAPHA